jgi:hypothetical protein
MHIRIVLYRFYKEESRFSRLDGQILVCIGINDVPIDKGIYIY